MQEYAAALATPAGTRWIETGEGDVENRANLLRRAILDPDPDPNTLNVLCALASGKHGRRCLADAEIVAAIARSFVHDRDPRFLDALADLCADETAAARLVDDRIAMDWLCDWWSGAVRVLVAASAARRSRTHPARCDGMAFLPAVDTILENTVGQYLSEELATNVLVFFGNVATDARACAEMIRVYRVHSAVLRIVRRHGERHPKIREAGARFFFISAKNPAARETFAPDALAVLSVCVGAGDPGQADVYIAQFVSAVFPRGSAHPPGGVFAAMARLLRRFRTAKINTPQALRALARFFDVDGLQYGDTSIADDLVWLLGSGDERTQVHAAGALLLVATTTTPALVQALSDVLAAFVTRGGAAMHPAIVQLLASAVHKDPHAFATSSDNTKFLPRLCRAAEYAIEVETTDDATANALCACVCAVREAGDV